MYSNIDVFDVTYLLISVILHFSRSIRSGDSADRRVLHGLRPVLDRCHTDRGRRPEWRHLLGVQSQPSWHIASVRRNTDEPDQLSRQSGRSIGPDRRRLRYWQKGKCSSDVQRVTMAPSSFTLHLYHLCFNPRSPVLPRHETSSHTIQEKTQLETKYSAFCQGGV